MNTLRQPLLRELTAALLVALLLLQSATAVAPGPAWWSTQGVTDPSAVADDFAVANIGQLKHMAAKAAAAMDAELPGGAGAAIHALVDVWGDTLEAASKPDNGLAINQGQLKHVATPFYDRLGLPYPWAGSSALRDDYLLVNLGQLKHVFSFPLKFRTLGQGAVTIPQATLQAAVDAWNALPAKPLGSTAGDFDGDGIPNLQEYLMSHALFDPLDIDGDRIADAVEDARPGILSKLNFADAVWDKEAGGAAAYYDLDWNVSYQGDGVMNYEEVLRLGLDPAATTTSTRTDGLTDAEVLVWTLNAGVPLALNADPLRTFWEGINAGWMDATANGSYLGWLDAGDANNDGEPDGLAEFRADMLNPWPVWEPWNPSVWTVQAPSPVSFLDPVTLSSVLMDWDEDGMADTDRDDDGLPDLWEYRYEFDLRDGEDRNHDADNDGLTNLEEYQLGTNPRLADTDGDGFDDHSESTGDGDPLVATIVPALSLSLAGSSHPYVFPGQTTPALAVKVTQGDLPVAGVTVVFDLGATAGRLLPAMHLAASPGMQMSVTTGADGVAAVTYAAGSEPGSASITATAPGLTGAVEFGVTVVPVPQPFGAGGSGGGGTYGGPATVQPSKPPRSGAATAQETAAATSDGFRIRVKRRDGADDDPVDAKPYSDLVPEYLQPSGLNLAALVGYQISFDVHSWQFHTRLDFEPLPMSGPYQKPPVPGGSRQYLVVVYNAVDVESDARVPKHVGGLSFQYTSSGGRQILLTGNIPDTFIKVESSGNNPSVKFEPPPASKPEERVWIRLLPVEISVTSVEAAYDPPRVASITADFSVLGKTNWGNVYEDYNVPQCVVDYDDVLADSNTFEIKPFVSSLDFKPRYIPNQSARWAKVGGPASGTLSGGYAYSTFNAPKEGGVYEFDCSFFEQVTRAYLVLPLAGAEVKDLIAGDIIKADAFATKVNAKYNFIERNLLTNGLRWFRDDGAGDYLGRPDNAQSRTVWKHNQVSSAGMGAVCTWFGTSIRVGKLSNFLVAYACRKIGVTETSALIAQWIGTSNDGSAIKSWEAGWKVGGGATYSTTVQALVKDVWDESDQKTKRLWPNSKPLDNHVSRSAHILSIHTSWDRHFSSPGFLEMTTP